MVEQYVTIDGDNKGKGALRYTFVALAAAISRQGQAAGSYFTDGDCRGVATRLTRDMLEWLKLKARITER